MNEKYNYRKFIDAYTSFVRKEEKCEELSRVRTFKAKSAKSCRKTMPGFGTVSMNRKG